MSKLIAHASQFTKVLSAPTPIQHDFASNRLYSSMLDCEISDDLDNPFVGLIRMRTVEIELDEQDSVFSCSYATYEAPVEREVLFADDVADLSEYL